MVTGNAMSSNTANPVMGTVVASHLISPEHDDIFLRGRLGNRLVRNPNAPDRFTTARAASPRGANAANSGAGPARRRAARCCVHQACATGVPSPQTACATGARCSAAQ